MVESQGIPKVQKAVVVVEHGANYKVKVVNDYPVPDIKPDEILVRLTSSGVCHSDLSMVDESWGALMIAKVPGHEGSGYIVKHGKDVDPSIYPLGTKVGVPLIYNPCRTCSACVLPDGEAYCIHNKYYSTHIDGTWQQYVPVHSQYVIPIPNVADDTEVGPILCGGLTVYRGLKVSQGRAGQWIAITGAGGGLGSLAIQYASALGLRVIAIDSGLEKEKLTKSLGAEVFVDYSKEDTVSSVKKASNNLGAKVALMLAPTESAYNQAISYLGFQGTLVCIGLPKSGVNLTFPPAAAIYKGLTIVGSLVGTRSDILEALDFLARGKVHPPVTLYKMEDIQGILERMTRGELQGRAVIDLN